MKYNISTFASKFGVKRIAEVAAFVLSATYGVAIALPALLPGAFKTLPMAGGHFLFLVYFLANFRNLNSSEPESIKKFYKAIWNLFYLEYCLYPFI